MQVVDKIVSAISIYLFQIWLVLNSYNDYLINIVLKNHDLFLQEFDYIVVGAGTAGSIVAARLAQDTDVQVLLIEAGSHPPLFFDVPLLAPILQLSDYDWQYDTIRQTHACKGLNEESSKWPLGRVVGGSGGLNYAMYIRGHKADFDSWGDKGNVGWYYDDVLPYFKRGEEQRGSHKNDSYFHSTSGHLPVEDIHFITPLATAFLDAGKELGFIITDLNKKDDTGFMLTQTTTDQGRKTYTARAYLNHKPQNLKIITNAVATKILFRDKYEAYALNYSQFKQNFTVKAHRGIILCAGTVGSAKLLMLSGIGPKDHLKENKIDLVRNLPVGNNLQDHITTGPDLILLNRSLPLSTLDIASPSAAWEYFIHGKGPLSAPGCEALALLHTNTSSSSAVPADIQLMLLPMGISSDGGFHMKNAIKIKDELWNEYFTHLQGQQVASIMPVLLHPKSMGKVLLRSKNPLDPPLIDPKYLTHPDDLQVLYEGIKIVKKLINTRPLKALGAKLYEKTLPGCSTYKFDSEAYWHCYIQHITLTAYHPVGTCRMGKISDPTSVVDAQLRVHDTNHLYVVDASIMPSLPSGNINAAVTMIAEKGTDIIKKQWYDEISKCHKIEIFMAKQFTNIIVNRGR